MFIFNIQIQSIEDKPAIDRVRQLFHIFCGGFHIDEYGIDRIFIGIFQHIKKHIESGFNGNNCVNIIEITPLLL